MNAQFVDVQHMLVPSQKAIPMVMATSQRYSVQQPPVSTLLAWISEGEIAIPEIQRPFVWEPVKVRNLLDSLYRGFPVGFLIAWKNPDVKLKDGTTSFGKRILIDGQQRITALMASLLGMEVVNRNYKHVRIAIAFHPLEERFEVTNPAIRKDAAWIADIATVFASSASLFKLVNEYCVKNTQASPDDVANSIESLRAISSNQIGLIELAPDLDIDTVTEIFIRVNSAGKTLSQADFVMSKIAVNEVYGGNALRKAIDYFCHLAVTPDFYAVVRDDVEFAKTPYAHQLAWLSNENDDLYDPSYTDMLRVAFTSQFGRGELSALVALLSGRNFATRQYEEQVVDESFASLKTGVMQFMNETNYKRFVMILRSAGFVNKSMITSTNAVNFAYILYLVFRERGMKPEDIERTVRRWFVMSLLTSRYSGAAETTFGQDVGLLREGDPLGYADQVYRVALSESFWEVVLPGQLDTSSVRANTFQVYKAAQIRSQDKGFLSRDISILDLITVKSDVHHIFPRDFLKKAGVEQTQYNQIANFAIAQSEINIQIGNKEPAVYFSQLRDQIHGGDKRYGNISDPQELAANMRMNCIPEEVLEMGIHDYPAFLVLRRKLMAAKMRAYFEGL